MSRMKSYRSLHNNIKSDKKDKKDEKVSLPKGFEVRAKENTMRRSLSKPKFKMRKKRIVFSPSEFFILLGICLIVLFVVSSIILSIVLPFSTQENVMNVTVTDKERITEGSGDSLHSRYIIYTDVEVIENTDTLLLGKFDSSDTYRLLEEGSTYNFRVYGWRVPFLSWYRNIISYELVDSVTEN